MPQSRYSQWIMRENNVAGVQKMRPDGQQVPITAIGKPTPETLDLREQPIFEVHHFRVSRLRLRVDKMVAAGSFQYE